MGSLEFSLATAVVVLLAGLAGLKLKVLLPDEHGPDKARDMIGAMTGLLGLLLALVLGTLVGSSYTIYATQKAEIDAMAAKVLQLDEALAATDPTRRRAGRGCAGRSRRATTRSGAARPPS